MAEDVPPSKINLFTLNCWGLKFIAKHRRERLHEIGKRIAAIPDPPNIVCLQECWTREDYHAIRKETRQILPYGKFYYSGIFGGGLAILSKWPIEESDMHRYPLNGRPTAFFRGDWFVGKGVACANIRIGPRPKDIAAVFCTHLHAPYEKEPHDSYICHRTAQAWEIAKLMRNAAERGYLVIGMGDFNMLPSSLAHQVITTLAPVKDVWKEIHPDSSVGAAEDAVEKARKQPVPTAEYNIKHNGASCDGPFNTWRWPKKEQKKLRYGNIETDGSQPDPKGKRLDYIFIGDTRYNLAYEWVVQDVKLGMMERHPTLHCSLSDHFSIEATIVRSTSHEDIEAKDPRRSTELKAKKPTLEVPANPERNRATSSDTLREINDVDMPPRANTATDRAHAEEMYNHILRHIEKYVARERFQRRFRIGNFFLGLLVAIGCFIAEWWSPRDFVAFILCFVSTIVFALGTIDLWIGFLFVSTELRALREFEWDVRNTKRLALGEDTDIEAEIEKHDPLWW